MKRFVPLIADATFAAVCAFLLFFTLIRYYFGAGAGLAAGICAGLAAGVGAFCYIKAKQKKSSDLALCEAEAQKLAMHLAMLEPDKSLELFARGLDDVQVCDGRAECENKVYFANFSPEAAGMNDLLPAVRYNTEKKKYFACCRATADCADFAAGAGITIISGGEIYSLLKEKNALPEHYLYSGKAGTKFFARIKARFSRKICLPAFWSGCALLFFSYFTYFPVYYIVMGSLLLLLCGVAAVFGKRNAG